ncbi:hypothetical protein Celaphus_00013891, partial [Cervus elaphus hippelaphus]
MIKNLKMEFGGDYGAKVTPNCFHLHCEVKWPPMGVGWPPENTMNLKIVKAVYTDLDGDDLTPPPYGVMRHLPPSAPLGPEAALMPDPGPGEVPAAATALPPALLEIVEPPFLQAPIPAMETSDQCPQDSTSAGPPRLYPPLL